jgi:hypothetical protein
VVRLLLSLTITFFGWHTFAPAALAKDASESVVFIRILDETGQQKSYGSGFLLNPAGFIVTANHIFELYIPTASDKIAVSLRSRNGPQLPAQNLSCNPSPNRIDICIIKINEQDVAAANVTNFFPLSCREISKENISALGYPIGSNNTINNPIGRVTGGIGEQFLYPAAIAILPGMSGGPVLDEAGAVIGVTMGAEERAPQFAFLTPLLYARSMITDVGAACSDELPPISAKWTDMPPAVQLPPLPIVCPCMVIRNPAPPSVVSAPPQGVVFPPGTHPAYYAGAKVVVLNNCSADLLVFVVTDTIVSNWSIDMTAAAPGRHFAYTTIKPKQQMITDASGVVGGAVIPIVCPH